uniref:Sas10 C-terminal domain-containing protein n=1 Tax=Salix viminalis TaxID=40686 RepID=A0A6N2MEI3_SALVM
MAKKGSQKKDGSSRSGKRKTRGEYVDPQNMDDDIDSFHKQRDIIPLDVDADVGELSDDEEEPIFDDEAINNDEDEDEEEDEDDDDSQDNGLAAKIIRQQKFLRAKFGDFDDELQDEEEDEEGAQNIVWSGNRSHDYHGGDNRDIELDSSDEALKEEEEEVLKLQRERAKNLSVEDFGLKNDEDESDKEQTLGEISNQGKRAKKARLSEDAVDELGTTFELKKDLNELSRKEQMEIISSSAPELVGLLSELNSTLEELENKVKVEGTVLESGLRYLQGKQLLLLSYCQNITFYLLLKSEGQPVLDHPPRDAIELLKTESLTGGNRKEGKHKRKNDEVGVQSMEMLKVRAALEEKLKQKGAFSSFSSKPDKAQKHPRPVNGRLESHEDYDDDVVDGEKGNRRLSDGHTSSLGSKRLSKLVISKQNKPKVVSGDDDLPTRDDIGERRRKHELGVLADAGIRTEDDAGIESDKNDDMDEDADSSENDLYEQVKQKRAAKLAAKAEIYTRTSAPPSLPETADGKRHITYQIEKNRGLTRPRNKLTKNPRKKYRTEHDKAQKRRLGQVRQIKKPSGPYGGESSGINARISRSIRL